MMSTKMPKSIKVPIAEPLDQRDPKRKAEPTKMLLFFPLKDDPTKCIQIITLLPNKEKNQLLYFLYWNVDIFA